MIHSKKYILRYINLTDLPGMYLPTNRVKVASQRHQTTHRQPVVTKTEISLQITIVATVDIHLTEL